MRSNNQQENKALTPMQKQAVLVCIVCALAALLTIGITLTMLKRGKSPTEQPGDSSIITPAPAPEGEEDISDHYQINETSSALLTGTADAGDAYQEQTLFIGGASMDESRDTKTEVVRYVLGQPALLGKRVLMVGDRNDDMQGAADCGLDAAGVLYGYGSREELEAFHPVLLAESCADLTDRLLAARV